jgi:hypothetical protein
MWSHESWKEYVPTHLGRPHARTLISVRPLSSFVYNVHVCINYACGHMIVGKNIFPGVQDIRACAHHFLRLNKCLQ